ncbi:phage antirepressor KilAC domain-containing protein [Acinetobacter pollinis]|uniref:phage antirepressor KilAC domain-containing protein n=1 Tax=Acinetobacter pollinis TaxID=2605270 RepID=UPI0018A29D81|nr:phage antirepressor KilAC domain-containing protein [Acinetobacter pollinis]MBF7691560.1 phage antirepressor KilAC domain-containing protein [Acinetobacter pollinis]MBF7699258.1 phage antirepressor KilAC domain-containing protein [Acinetobacter pollinis]
MNMITQFNHNQKSMTSPEISDLLQSRHDVVKKSIDRLVERNVIVQPPMVDEQFKDSMGRIRTTQVYVFTGEQGKLDSITVVAQLCPEFTAALVKRWYELENQQQLPQSFAEALQLAADQAKQLELQAPKVNFYDKLADRTTLMNATQVAQKIKMSAQKLNKILDTLNVYSHAVKRGRVFKQWFIDQGYGELKETDLGYSQAMFTTKGEQWVFEQLTNEGII